MEDEADKPRQDGWAKRKTLLIYPGFQLKLIAINAAVTGAMFLFVWIQAWRAFSKLVDLGQKMNLAADHPFFQFLDFQSSRLYANLAIAFVAGLAVSTIVMVVLSQRLAGPIIRVRGYFRRIGQTGKIESELKFRKGDFFTDLPAVVNEALVALDKKQGRS